MQSTGPSTLTLKDPLTPITNPMALRAESKPLPASTLDRSPEKRRHDMKREMIYILAKALQVAKTAVAVAAQINGNTAL